MNRRFSSAAGVHADAIRVAVAGEWADDDPAVEQPFEDPDAHRRNPEHEKVRLGRPALEPHLGERRMKVVHPLMTTRRVSRRNSASSRAAAAAAWAGRLTLNGCRTAFKTPATSTAIKP